MSDADSPSSSAPIAPSVFVNHGPIRATSETVEVLGARSHQADADGAGADLTGRNAIGQSIPREQWDESTIVTSAKLGGDGKISSLLASGLIVRGPDGLYGLPGQVAPVSPTGENGEQQQETPPAEPQADAARDAQDAALIAALPPLPAEVSSFMKTITETAGEGFVSSVVGTVAEGGEMDGVLHDAASVAGMEPAQAKAGLENQIAARTAVAKQIGEAIGVPDVAWEHFTEDLHSRPGEYREVLQGMAEGNIAPLTDSLRAYAKAGKMADAFEVDGLPQVGEGVEAKLSQDGKQLLLSIKGHGLVTFHDAVKRGLVRVSKAAR